MSDMTWCPIGTCDRCDAARRDEQAARCPNAGTWRIAPSPSLTLWNVGLVANAVGYSSALYDRAGVSIWRAIGEACGVFLTSLLLLLIIRFVFRAGRALSRRLA